MIYVLDTSAMIGYVNGEAGSEIIEELLTRPEVQCQAHAVSFTELSYRFRLDRGVSRDEAERMVTDLIDAGIMRLEVMDRNFNLRMADLRSNKASLAKKNLPLGDLFVVALAQQNNATVVTCDHEDFEPLANDKALDVLFFR